MWPPAHILPGRQQVLSVCQGTLKKNTDSPESILRGYHLIVACISCNSLMLTTRNNFRVTDIFMTEIKSKMRE